MERFKRSFKFRQSILKFSHEEVCEVLQQQTYMGIMLMIGEIKRRHETTTPLLEREYVARYVS